MQGSYKRIGDFIRLVDERNAGLKVKNLLGLSISKQFIPSVANIIGTDMENYKIIRKNQFACSTMQVRRDKKMPVALLQEVDEAIISQAYPVFEVTNTEKLLPEYLMMWFSRQEFDREACFYAIGGVRGSLEWEDFCEMELPIPHPDKQKEIVKEYNTIVNRIALNNQLIQKLEETAQGIYKHWFVDFEFPDEEGKPYKSNGGEMVESELGEIPKVWRSGKFGDLINVFNGYAFGSNDFNESGNYPILKIGNINSQKVSLENSQYYSGEFTSVLKNFIVESGDILISMTGSHMSQMSSAVGKVGRYNHKAISLLNQRVSKIKPKGNMPCKEYSYCFISKLEAQKQLLMGATGSANQANISPSQIKSLPIIIPSINVLKEFEYYTGVINNRIIFNEQMSKGLESLKDLLLSKLATIEN